ncbi:TIGR03621 family F420-dependent LLM class oxidoreductase [Thermomonospora umbrina]|uniref:Putative F420-dependent oxidoreductase n=1 Tax=Thermomonospora umbrina TaxID=111806 RepID=A0A3D9SY60_9ACTN|nr:TIGR03621 family F420-dependent LLM class oxidoreductase [Thermomonospora umbrina]REE99450.1 putative F420-dependent oxidoreductase [Thermomonospora umbrina]
MRDFRFGFNFRDIPSRAALVDRCRLAEHFGYDVALVPDHLGGPAPFTMMVAAAEATERMRVGTLVLNVPFWNPHLLAREVSTADVLTDGRVELGLGAGHMKWEFDAAGIEWRPFGPRAQMLEETIQELGRLFAGPEYPERTAIRAAGGLTELKPVQRRGFDGSGPPLVVGGTGDRVLRVAARYADTVAYGGVYQIKGEPPGTFRLGNADEAEERVRFVGGLMGERADEVESSVLIQLVAVTGDRRAEAARLAAGPLAFLTAEEILETPFVLLGTHAQIAEQLVERRERFGYSYITVHGVSMEALGPVIELLR